VNAPTPNSPAEAETPTPATGWGRWRYVAVPVFVVAAILILRDFANRPPWLAGDIWEHWLIAESFDRHGTPELFQDEDTVPVYAEAARLGLPKPPVIPHAYLPTPKGRIFGVHFWGYAMCGVPVKAYLRWSGRSELAWPGLLNAIFFLLAVGITLFVSTAPVGERLALAGLSIAGPGWLYVGWPGSELYSWAFILIAVVLFRDRRYGWSALACALASLQNPPLLVFGGITFLMALRERRWLSAVGTILGTVVGLIPYAFFYYHFGKPSPIAADFARTAYISWCRTWSQLTDLSQGLLPFVPLLVFGFGYAAVRIVIRRDLRALLLLGATIAVAVGTQVSRNWNSGCDGLQRYLVWLIPLLAGVVVYGFRNRCALWVFTVCEVLVHSALLPIYQETNARDEGYLGHTAMAKWVLNHCPELYWAEPEVFIERTRHDEIDWAKPWESIPAGYARPDGTVSKLLLDAQSVEKVPTTFEVEEAYLAALRAEAASRSDPAEQFYVHPPRGAVRVKAKP
jgi:hypothetical protein